MDTKKKSGLFIFFISAFYMMIIGWGFGWWSASVYRNLPLAEIANTAWAWDKPLFWFWAFALPSGSILIAIGALVLGDAKGKRILFIGLGLLLANVLIQQIPQTLHYPPLFGIFGGSILGLFLITAWIWTQKRIALDSNASVAADFQLVGYVFLIIAMWFLCGSLARQFFHSFTDIRPSSPVRIIIYLSLGWVFIFLGQYNELKLLRNKSSAAEPPINTQEKYR